MAAQKCCLHYSIGGSGIGVGGEEEGNNRKGIGRKLTFLAFLAPTIMLMTYNHAHTDSWQSTSDFFECSSSSSWAT